MRNKTVDMFFLTIVIIGAIYLGMVGLFGIDVFAMFLAGMPVFFTRVVFGLIGIAGLYAITLYKKIDDNNEVHMEKF